ncbi:MAG: AMP-ligase [Lysobacteraceae bacterium]|nr:MAG: AMP-ligase [Xanthomonadaceae bacterium]
MSQPTPIVTRPDSDTIARVDGHDITVSEFAAHVLWLAERLPESPFVVNLCADRYRFLVSFCAAMVRGQCSLLPPTRQPATVASIVDGHAGSYCLFDHPLGDVGGDKAPKYDWSQSLAQLQPKSETDLPKIPGAQLCAMSFTSGSTGPSQAIAKRWKTFDVSTEINARYMVPEAAQLTYLTATVPAQHMWGLETSVLLPLRASVATTTSRPMFPADVATALADTPGPRMLVTSPVHLRALTRSSVAFPAVESVLCATSPLPQEIAVAAEQTFNGRLLEIYGCSEVGSMARRFPVTEASWEPFDALNFRRSGAGWTVDADHLTQAQSLADQLVFAAEGRFELQGRVTDMVKIAGKRASMEALNQILLRCPKVKDGVLFQPQHGEQVAERLAGLVVAGPNDYAEVIAWLRENIDGAFVPRPLRFVDSIPRAASGKPSLQALMAELTAHD